VAAALVTVGCGSSNSSGFNSANGSPAGDDAGSGFAGGGNGDILGGASDGGALSVATLPPEKKVENAYKSPVATGHIVWIADPLSGRVAYIDATTFAVQTASAGNAPTYIAAVPDVKDDVAIVHNVLSQDATLMRVQNGSLTVPRTYASTPDANSWAVSKSGRWAIAWTDSQFVQGADPTQGFQDIEVIDLSKSDPTTAVSGLTVGYRPSQIAFSGDESHAYAVTQDGISVLDLTGGATPAAPGLYHLTAPVVDAGTPVDAGGQDAPAPEAGNGDAAPEASPDASPEASSDASGDAPDAPLGSSLDATTDGPTVINGGASGTPDVSFTPDGAYALVRVDGSSSLTVISLATGKSVAVNLPSPATDLSMSPTGTFAVAAMRTIYSVAVLPIPGIFTSPTSFATTVVPGEIIGRSIVTNSGSSALLFTTAAAVPRMTVLSLGAQPSYRTVTLHAPILAVFPTPDGNNAIVLHSMTTPASTTVKGAFSIVPVSVDLPAKIVGVPAPPIAVAISPKSDTALVTISDDSSTFGVYLGRMPSLEVTPFTLASPPTAVGIASAANRGYVAQNYADGRITFLDLSNQTSCDGSPSCNLTRTITGFELAARVVNGSSQ
jgi:hypothetical protein